MKLFMPKLVFFEPESLNYPLGKTLHDLFSHQGIPIKFTKSHNRVTGIPGNTPQEAYRYAKQTLVVGVKRGNKLETCKPSAHYQFPVATSCPGGCQYCYLQTTLGNKPYVRIYVNIDEILDNVADYIKERSPQITFFEISSTSDPLAVEHLTGSLAKTIVFFGRQEYGRLRTVTKFSNVDSLLELPHNAHTRFRFSVNAPEIIQKYEQHTATLQERIAAAQKMQAARYPIGFIIAPIFWEQGWKEKYHKLFQYLSEKIVPDENLTFELITHRYTIRAKNVILNRFPNTKLEMDEKKRRFKFGKFGYGKYLYLPEQMEEIKAFFYTELENYFPQAKIEYFI